MNSIRSAYYTESWAVYVGGESSGLKRLCRLALRGKPVSFVLGIVRVSFRSDSHRVRLISWC